MMVSDGMASLSRVYTIKHAAHTGVRPTITSFVLSPSKHACISDNGKVLRQAQDERNLEFSLLSLHRQLDANVQLFQLRFADFGGRIGEQARSGLRLGEGNHIANAIGTGHEHH